MRLSVYRRAHFNAAHRIYNPAWDDAKNEAVFGLCNNPYFHGHNYELEVCVTGEVDPQTGYVYLQVVEFQTLIPSAEHICYVIYTWLRQHIENEYDIRVRLWETPRNSVCFPAENH